MTDQKKGSRRVLPKRRYGAEEVRNRGGLAQWVRHTKKEVWNKGIPKRRYGTAAYQKGGMEQRHTKKEVWNRGIPKRRYGTEAYQKGGMEQGSSGIGGPAQAVPQKGKSYTEEVRYRFTI